MPKGDTQSIIIDSLSNGYIRDIDESSVEKPPITSVSECNNVIFESKTGLVSKRKGIEYDIVRFGDLNSNSTFFQNDKPGNTFVLYNVFEFLGGDNNVIQVLSYVGPSNLVGFRCWYLMYRVGLTSTYACINRVYDEVSSNWLQLSDSLSLTLLPMVVLTNVDYQTGYSFLHLRTNECPVFESWDGILRISIGPLIDTLGCWDFSKDYNYDSSTGVYLSGSSLVDQANIVNNQYNSPLVLFYNRKAPDSKGRNFFGSIAYTDGMTTDDTNPTYVNTNWVDKYIRKGWYLQREVMWNQCGDIARFAKYNGLTSAEFADLGVLKITGNVQNVEGTFPSCVFYIPLPFAGANQEYSASGCGISLKSPWHIAACESEASEQRLIVPLSPVLDAATSKKLKFGSEAAYNERFPISAISFDLAGTMSSFYSYDSTWQVLNIRLSGVFTADDNQNIGSASMLAKSIYDALVDLGDGDITVEACGADDNGSIIPMNFNDVYGYTITGEMVSFMPIMPIVEPMVKCVFWVKDFGPDNKNTNRIAAHTQYFMPKICGEAFTIPIIIFSVPTTITTNYAIPNSIPPGVTSPGTIGTMLQYWVGSIGVADGVTTKENRYVYYFSASSGLMPIRGHATNKQYNIFNPWITKRSLNLPIGYYEFKFTLVFWGQETSPVLFTYVNDHTTINNMYFNDDAWATITHTLTRTLRFTTTKVSDKIGIRIYLPQCNQEEAPQDYSDISLPTYYSLFKKFDIRLTGINVYVKRTIPITVNMTDAQKNEAVNHSDASFRLVAMLDLVKQIQPMAQQMRANSSYASVLAKSGYIGGNPSVWDTMPLDGPSSYTAGTLRNGFIKEQYGVRGGVYIDYIYSDLVSGIVGTGSQGQETTYGWLADNLGRDYWDPGELVYGGSISYKGRRFSYNCSKKTDVTKSEFDVFNDRVYYSILSNNGHQKCFYGNGTWVSIKEGDFITKIVSFRDFLHVFGAKDLYKIDMIIGSNNLDDIAILDTFGSQGTTFPNSIVVTGVVIVWANIYSIWVYDGQQVQDSLQGRWKNDYITYIASVTDPNLVIGTHCPRDNTIWFYLQGQPTQVVWVYQVENNCWTKFTLPNITVNQMVVALNGVFYLIYSTPNDPENAHICYYPGPDYTDNMDLSLGDVTYTSNIITQRLYADPGQDKQFQDMNILYEALNDLLTYFDIEYPTSGFNVGPISLGATTINKPYKNRNVPIPFGLNNNIKVEVSDINLLPDYFNIKYIKLNYTDVDGTEDMT